MNEIIPAVIPPNLNYVREKFSKILGLVDKVQLDVVDGEYAPTKTWPFNGNQFDEMIKITRGEERFPYAENFILEVDMMVVHPIEYLTDFIGLGAKSFVIHIDSTDHVKECIETIKNSGCQIGLGIKPSVDTSLLEPFLPEVNFIQFMGNDRIGYNGVELDKNVLKKIEEFHKSHPSTTIQVDIGVGEETIPKLKEVGVSRFISSSSIFNTPDIKEAIKNLKNC